MSKVKICYFSATGSEMQVLSRAYKKVLGTHKISLEFVVRSQHDLSDPGEIEDFGRHIEGADYTIMVLMGGKISCPGFDDYVRRAKILHVQPGSQPEDIKLSEEYSNDYGSEQFNTCVMYIKNGGVDNICHLLLYVYQFVTGEEINVPAYKIASFEITDIPLIEYVASKGKPVIISTGIATLSDIEEAVNACKRMGNNQIALLKCTSAYPAPLEDVNLRTIPNMASTFKTVVGLSDHTLGISVPIASVALGACIIEKHLTLDRSLGGPDAAFSLEPSEFKAMVKSVREVEKALGEVSYNLTEKMKKSRELSRSLFVIKDIKAGEVFTEENVRSIRPGYGLHPRYLKNILGKKAAKDIKNGTPLNSDLIS